MNSNSPCLYLFFFFFMFGFLGGGEFAFGCPTTERFFRISISASERSYILFTPIIWHGSYPAFFMRLRVASVVTGFLAVPIFWLISKTVSFIPLLYRLIYRNQEGKVITSDNRTNIPIVGQNTPVKWGILPQKIFTNFLKKLLTIQ